MKKLASLIVAMMLALCACWTSAEEAPADPLKTVMGTLSLLNMSEEDYTVKIKGRIIGLRYLAEKGVYHSQQDVRSIPEDGGVVFYDSLNAMLMALEVGDITSAEAPVCVAEYLCAHNDRLMLKGIYDLSGADDFTKQVAYRLGVGYAFLTTEDKAALRDEIDAAITEMKEDGTLDALIQSYITDAVNGEPEPVEFTKTDGETIRVAVTGSLPPIDYVAADGTPAGFNTAILAELGKRMNVNFELVQVDSLGRAAALASGQVDLVFWTNGADGRDLGGRQTNEEHEAILSILNQEQLDLMLSISGGIDYFKTQNMDIPDGTITTQPYFSDLMIAVAMK